jgi:hypothetical protein
MENMFICSFVFFLGMVQLRQVLIIFICNLILWVTLFSGSGSELTVKSYSFAMEMLFFLCMFTLKGHQKEMAKRKIHNRKIIIDFESKRTNNLLGNLVPPPVL